MSKASHSRITLVVDGVSYGTWDKWSGLTFDSAESKYAPGGMGDEIARGGRKTTSNVTVERLYELDRDPPLIRALERVRGYGRATVSDQALNPDRSPAGEPIVVTGVLKAVTPPTRDSTSDEDAMWSVEISTDSAVG